jgi:hypothetical protein
LLAFVGEASAADAEEVGAGHDAHEATVGVDDGQVLDAFHRHELHRIREELVSALDDLD